MKTNGSLLKLNIGWYDEVMNDLSHAETHYIFSIEGKMKQNVYIKVLQIGIGFVWTFCLVWNRRELQSYHVFLMSQLYLTFFL